MAASGGQTMRRARSSSSKVATSVGPIGGERRRQQPRREFPIQPVRAQWAKPQGIFNLKDVRRGEFDLVWRHRRIASQRGSVAQRRRRIEQQVVAHLVEVSALENAENKV